METIPEILVLGFDCTKCKQLLSNLEEAIRLSASKFSIRRIENVDEILSWNPKAIPSLVFNNEVYFEDKIPPIEDLLRLFTSR